MQLTPPKKIYYLTYCGKIAFHHSYAPSMTRWLIASVRLKYSMTFCSMTIDQDGISTKEEDKFDSQGSQTSVNTAESHAGLFKSISSSGVADGELSEPTAQSLPFVVPYQQIVEVVMPTESEKDCVGVIVNRSPNQPLELYVYQNDDVQMVCHCEVMGCLKILFVGNCR